MGVGKILFIGVVRGKLTNENVFLTRQFKRENLVGQQENVKADVSASFLVSSRPSTVFLQSVFQSVPATVFFLQSSVSSRYSQFFS